MVAPSAAFEGITRGLSQIERTALFQAGRARRYSPNARVFSDGDHSDFVIVIVEGRVKVFVTSREGEETVLGIRGPGAVVGEFAAFDGGPRVASAVALESLTVRVLTAEEFRAFIEQRPKAGLELIRTLIGRLGEADRRRAEFGVYDTVSRVAHLLSDLAAEQRGGTDELEVRLSQQDIAGLVGASRESVVRALTTLRNRGLVTTGRRTIRVLDPDALRSFAD